MPKLWKFRLPLASTLGFLSLIQFFMGLLAIILISTNQFNELLLEYEPLFADDISERPKKFTTAKAFASFFLIV